MFSNQKFYYYVHKKGEEKELNRLGGNWRFYKSKKRAENYVAKLPDPENYVIYAAPIVIEFV